jgi:DMSO/TMAO reductase YedYZ heme-binding membrane subunit
LEREADMRVNWFEGWRLFALLMLTLTALSLWIAGMHGFDADGMRRVIRFTARTSLLFFCMAFSAASVARLRSNGWTRWQRRNRRYIGVTFAGSHGLHAIAIAAFAAIDPAGFIAASSMVTFIFGGIGYSVIAAMTATSFDRTADLIGPRAWRSLHLFGGYYLWLQFMVSFGMRVPAMPLYALFLVPPVAAMAARLVAMAASRSAKAEARLHVSRASK